MTLLVATAATRTVSAATAAALSAASGVAFTAEFLLHLFAALGAVRIVAVVFNEFFAYMPALRANKFY